MLQYSTIFYNSLQYSTIFFNILHYSTIFYNILQYSTIFYIILHYSTIFYNILHYSTIFFNILQHSSTFYTIFLNILQYSTLFYNILQYSDGCFSNIALDRKRQKKKNIFLFQVQCFPLYTLLVGMGNPTVHLFVLDIEGFELGVLRHIPWDKVDIQVSKY